MVKPDFNPNTLLLKQYLRWLPAQLGLINYGAFRLQINEIRKTDCFLVSYPKSGNTWLRYIVATALHGRSNFSFAELEEIVPDVYVSKRKINGAKGQRIIKTHDPLFDYYPHSVYIYRDVRQVMVSYYHYAVNARQFNGNFAEFIRSKYPLVPFGSWARHIKKALEAKSKGMHIHLVKYEGLLQSPETEITGMLKFLHIKPVIEVAQIVQYCTFGVLQQTERERGSYFGNRQLFFRQGGKPGEEELKKTDFDYLLRDGLTKEIMQELGYTY